MNFKKNLTVLKEYIDFIQNYNRRIIKGDTPYNEGDKEVRFSITKDKILQIPKYDNLSRRRNYAGILD